MINSVFFFSENAALLKPNSQYQIVKGDGTESLRSLMYRSLIEKMHIFQKVGEFWKWQNLRTFKIPLTWILGNFWRFKSIREKNGHNKNCENCY